LLYDPSLTQDDGLQSGKFRADRIADYTGGDPVEVVDADTQWGPWSGSVRFGSMKPSCRANSYLAAS